MFDDTMMTRELGYTGKPKHEGSLFMVFARCLLPISNQLGDDSGICHIVPSRVVGSGILASADP